MIVRLFHQVKFMYKINLMIFTGFRNLTGINVKAIAGKNENYYLLK